MPHTNKIRTCVPPPELAQCVYIPTKMCTHGATVYNRAMLDSLLQPAAIFRICSTLILPAWLLLIVAPRWKGTHRFATGVLPLVLALAYVGMLASAKTPAGAGFKDLPSVMLLFTSPAAVTAGWIHYLCFDLFTGAWQVREAQRIAIAHWLTIPCLLLTFFFGPVGLLLFLLLRWGMRGHFGVLPVEPER